MIREVFTNPNPWAVLGMLAMVGLFGLIIWYVASDRRKGHLTRMEHLPLEDDRHG
jgi:cbb3-type cytochrome oxidase subunit 3